MADISNLKERAESYLAEGNLDSAKECYLEAIALAPNQAETYHKLGEVLSLQKSWKEAVDAYCQAIKINPSFSWAYHKLGYALTELGSYREAVEAYKMAIQLNPEFPWSYQKLGELSMELENWDEAIFAYRRFIEINPDFTAAYQKLGDACQQKGLLDEAVSCYYRVLEKTPNSAALLKKLGQLFQTLGRPQEAVSCYQKLIKLQPNNWEFYSMLGQCLVEVGEFEGAIESSDRAIKLNPNFPWCRYHLADALSKLQRWDEAAIAYEEAWHLQPDQNLFAEKLKSALQKGNLEDKLIVFYRQYLEINPLEWRYYRSLGEIYIQREDWQEAIACFIRALQFQLDCPPAYRQLADILEKQGNKRGAYRCKYHHILPQNLLIKYCNLTKNSIVESSQESNINYKQIYAASRINLAASQTIKTKVCKVLRSPNINSSKAFVAVIPEARAWAKHSISAVITSDNKLVTDISLGNAELILSSPNLPDFRYLDGTVAFLSLKWAKCGYFNWMFNVIARFDLLRRSGINCSEIDKFAVNKAPSKFQKETLKAVGVAEDRIIESESSPHLKAKKLIVPSIPAKAPNGFRSSKWACDFLKNQFLNPELTDKLPLKQERIYVSRKLASRRRIVNDEEVVSLLKKYGFIEVIFESMSVAEQALCMANAKVVVAPHGAGLTNLLFCNPGTKVIEIFSPKSIINTYWLLSNVCGLEHYYLLGEIFDDSYFSNSGCKDILVNLDSLLKLMKSAGVV